jgi:hypothetical protein
MKMSNFKYDETKVFNEELTVLLVCLILFNELVKANLQFLFRC